jgi:hypothetical protein
MKRLNYIDGFDDFQVNNENYEWNSALGQYQSIVEEPNALQEADVAILRHNERPIAVDDPTSIGFAFKVIADRDFSKRTELEQRDYMEQSKTLYDIDDWSGTLQWQHGECCGSVRLDCHGLPVNNETDPRLDSLNVYQTAVKEAYSDGDHSYIDSVQQAKTIGDSLFAFLMIELSDAEGCTDQETAWRCLETAKRDIDTAINAVLTMSL